MTAETRSPLGVVVVGTGTLGKRYARVLSESPHFRLVGVVSRDAERGRKLGEQYKAPQAFASLDEALSDSAVSAVCIATPDHLHAQPVLAALAARKHVLVEKPLATRLDEAAAMVRAANEAGRMLMVNYSFRMMPENIWLHDQIRSGAIGTPVSAASLKSDAISIPLNLSWARDSSSMHFLTSHDIDLILWFFGSRVKTVTAWGRKGVLAERGIDTYDSIDALLSFENGAGATVHSSWIHPDSFPTVVDKYLQILGTEGVIHIGRQDAREVKLYTRDSAQEVRFGYVATANEVKGKLLGSFRSMIDHFGECIVSGEEPVTSGARVLHATAVHCSIHTALETHESVRVPQFEEEHDN